MERPYDFLPARQDNVPVIITFGADVATLLESLPKNGPLFPRMARIQENHRAKMFIKRLKTVGITGISLHSYRYAWAERAKTVGMPERFAQQALGHSSKAIARAYSKKAQVIVPSLEDYERKIVPMPRMAAATVPTDRKSTRLNSSHQCLSRMPSSA